MEQVASTEEAKQKKQAELTALLKSVDAMEEHSFYKDDCLVIHRRIQTPKKKNAAPIQTIQQQVSAISPLTDLVPQEHLAETLSFHVTNFDDLYSKITWRDGPDTFFIWVNRAFTYLPAINQFAWEGVHYSYFGFADYVDSKIEAERAGQHLFEGQIYEYTSRWEEPPIEFGKKPEYIVIPEEPGVTVPEKLYTQMDAVFSYYLAERKSLRIQSKNTKRLNRARKQYLRENPPTSPEGSVLVYSHRPSSE